MNRIVLDASAILAVINSEPGVEKLTTDLLARAVGSAVNLAEVQTKLVSRGWSSEQAWEDGTSPVREVLPFDEEQAKVAGDVDRQQQLANASRLRVVNAARERIIGLYRLMLRDDEIVLDKAKGEPIYLILAMTPDRMLRMKPQNLITGLPIARLEAVS